MGIWTKNKRRSTKHQIKGPVKQNQSWLNKGHARPIFDK